MLAIYRCAAFTVYIYYLPKNWPPSWTKSLICRINFYKENQLEISIQLHVNDDNHGTIHSIFFLHSFSWISKMSYIGWGTYIKQDIEIRIKVLKSAQFLPMYFRPIYLLSKTLHLPPKESLDNSNPHHSRPINVVWCQLSLVRCQSLMTRGMGWVWIGEKLYELE